MYVSVMNTASENLEHHLGLLKQKLQHAIDYEQAFYYFLEEFAGDAKFVHAGETEESLHLQAAVTQVASKAFSSPQTLEQANVFRLSQFGFYHGNAIVAGRVVLFFYFESVDTGLMAMIPGVTGEAEIARFRPTKTLVDPKHN